MPEALPSPGNKRVTKTQRTHRETHRETHRDTQRDTERDTQRHTETHRETQRDTQRDTQRHTQRGRQCIAIDWGRYRPSSSNGGRCQGRPAAAMLCPVMVREWVGLAVGTVEQAVAPTHRDSQRDRQTQPHAEKQREGGREGRRAKRTGGSPGPGRKRP